MAQTWPLIGRDRELGLVGQALEDPGVHGVALIGEEGVGKSRLVFEALAVARARGLLTREAPASAAASLIPIEPLGHLLRRPSTTPADPSRVLSEARRILVEGFDGGRLALAVDDAHLLDGASSALVHQLAATKSAFMVITARKRARLPEAITRLWEDHLVRRVEVAPLAASWIGEIVTAALGGQVDSATRRELAWAVRGNLLFLRELVQFGLDSGYLTASDGVWGWHGPVIAGGRLCQVIEDRLRRLEPAERQLLEVLGASEPLGVALLERLASTRTLGALDDQGLLAVVSEGNRTSLRIAHPIHAQVVRSTTAPMRLRSIHAQLVEAILATGARRHGDRLQLTISRTESGHPPSVTDLVEGVRQTLACGDQRLAERLARTAVRVDGGFEARLLLGEALAAGARRDEAEEIFSSLTETTARDEETMRVGIARASNLLTGGGLRAAEANLVLERAETAVTDRTAVRDELAGPRGLLLLAGGDSSQALTVSSTIIDRPGATPSAQIRALRVAGLAHASRGQAQLALGCVDRGLRLLSTQEQGAETAKLERNLMATRWEALWFARRLDDAEALAWTERRRALGQRAERERGTATFQLGLCFRERGRVHSAVAWLREALALLRVYQPSVVPAALAAVAQAHAIAGDPAAAQTALDEAEADGDRPPTLEVRTGTSRAWVTAASGDVAGGQAIALRAADLAGGVDVPALEAIALHTVVRLGDPQAVATRLRAVAEGADSPLLPTMAQHAAASAAGDGVALDDVATAFEAMGMLLHAAEAAADASQAHRRIGDRSLVRDASARARALLHGCEGAHTPATERLQRPEMLTARQRQIAGLASRGLTSPEIADRLTLSTRTVDNHLQQIYIKLHVNNRAELPMALAAQAERSRTHA